MFATGKDGMSALSLQRALEIGSYPTAWAMLHRQGQRDRGRLAEKIQRRIVVVLTPLVVAD